ncbi:hypothetical protein T10_9384 [Trichinella papuae]|uniref:Reverse transcriptase RNase H-like domain-containing protein n=1 Tax=Trichinella papuae TaxID=268474 RepID=A0A0V1M1Z0_9BILA|nr:hypothetical protein T10_9384 [Trichinella papuae]
MLSSWVSNKAEAAQPLNHLLDKGVPHEKVFQKVKRLSLQFYLLKFSLLYPVLPQYDDQLPLILTCDVQQPLSDDDVIVTDALPHGVGCVLTHKLSCIRKAPIAFHSRTIAAAERQYA